MSFISSFISPGEYREPAWWFIFQKDSVLVQGSGGAVQIPRVPDAASLGVRPALRQYLGSLDGVHCHACEVEAGDAVPDGMTLMSLRALFGLVPDDLFWIAVRASMVMYWDGTSRFCGKCGQPARLLEDERAKVCTSCGFKMYPRISPAVIVAVIKDGHILLGRSTRFPQSFYSVLAGFVEPGETFEDCIRREVKEETGIDVKNIRYFSSQPWPFPDSLMIGFTAEYAGGEIRVDGEEVVEAGWYSAGNLPEIPGKVSIARRLIDWFVETNK